MNTTRQERVDVGKRDKDQVKQQRTDRPDLPLLDEHGFESIEFKCWRCARPDYREKNAAEAFLRNGHKLFCLPCARPDLFEWEVETLLDGTRREYIRPLSAKETYKAISPEARALAEKQALAQILRARRDAILQLTTSLEVEYMQLLDAIEAAEKDVIEATAYVSAAEKEQVHDKVAQLKRLQENVARLTYEVDAAKKAEAEAARKNEKTGR